MESDFSKTTELNRVLILHLAVPDHPLFFPASNYVGTRILSQLIDAQLKAQGQFIRPGVFAGGLNQAQMLFEVQEAHAAAAIIWRIIETIGLTGDSVLYRADMSEGVFRSLFPHRGQDILADKLLEKFAAAAAISLESWGGNGTVDKIKSPHEAGRARPIIF